MVVCRSAYVINIACSQAFLTGGCAREVQLYLTEEMVLELVHPGRSKQHGGVPGWNKNVAGLPMMSFGLEERQVFFA